MEKTQAEVSSIIVGTFATELGGRCIDHLKGVFIDRPIYRKGQTLEETAYRQGQADLVQQLLKEL